MSSLGKRLDALEQIAEEMRLRELRDSFRAEIERRYRDQRIPLAPADLERKVDRALALSSEIASLKLAGLTLPEIARTLAVAHDLDPDRVVAIFHELRADRGAAGGFVT